MFNLFSDKIITINQGEKLKSNLFFEKTLILRKMSLSQKLLKVKYRNKILIVSSKYYKYLLFLFKRNV